MSAAFKAIALLAVLFALANGLHHRSQKLTPASRPSGDYILQQQYNREQDLSDQEKRHDTIVHGKIVCEGEGTEGYRPYLYSPEYPKIILNIVSTNKNGWYRLSTGTDYEFHQVIYLTVRHQCEVNGLSPMPRCAIPYFTTEIAIDVRNTTYVMRNVELSEQAANTRADCLY